MPLSPDLLLYLATRPWELGDLATWLGATANVATVILALAAALVGYRVYKVESGRDARAERERRERAADERRVQASLISVWYGRSAESTPLFGRSGWSAYNWGGWIVNASDSPVYDATLRFHRLSTPTSAAASWTNGVIRVVPPYRGELLVSVNGEAAPDDLTDDERNGDLEVSLLFRDAAGRRWLRDRRGYLHEKGTPPDLMATAMVLA
ncbi:hypothetical protein [Micromonospora tarensis]|uniref:Uncharacterized protein n=1 Tax=Micromonospora tarensis TaxID=2806100 RepID=A0ABS1YEK0_9ACTN|nr:hypothetical protein [Micromonospora tarensis]MBM0275787.1 hypothetical protein [Micromonospora tarensis]